MLYRIGGVDKMNERCVNGVCCGYTAVLTFESCSLIGDTYRYKTDNEWISEFEATSIWASDGGGGGGIIGSAISFHAKVPSIQV